MKDTISSVLKSGRKILSEFESKNILKAAGVPITREGLAGSVGEAKKIADDIGYPVVLKGCGPKAAHKTEMGLVKLRINSGEELVKAYNGIMAMGIELDGVLVQEMIRGDREFIIGVARDRQFGPCIMFGLGGIFAEVLADTSFRIAPINEQDALEMIGEIKTHKLLDKFRGSPAVDRHILCEMLVAVSNLAAEYEEIAEIDINPLIISEGKPVAVDSLIVLE